MDKKGSHSSLISPGINSQMKQRRGQPIMVSFPTVSGVWMTSSRIPSLCVSDKNNIKGITIGKEVTFYYIPEWFEKPQSTQGNTEKNNDSLCPLCPLWLIFFAMIHFIRNILKSLMHLLNKHIKSIINHIKRAEQYHVIRNNHHNGTRRRWRVHAGVDK